MRTPRGKTRASLFLAGLIGALLAAAFALSPAGQSLENLTQDARFNFRGPRTTSAKVVVVAIDDATLKAWPEPMLFWGPRYAAVIRQLRKFESGWIGFDVIPTVYAAEWHYQQIPTPADDTNQLPDRQFMASLLPGGVALSYIDDLAPIPQLTSLPSMEGNLGFTDMLSENQEAVRQVQLYREGAEGVSPSLPLLLAARALGEDPQGAAAAWPEGRLAINYLGLPGSVRTLSAARMATGNLSPEEKDALKEAVVLIGPTFSGSNDFHRGPADRHYPGVEIMAHAVATLLDRRPMQIPGFPRPAVIALGCGALVATITMWLPPAGMSLIAAMAGAGWCALAVSIYRADHVLPIAGPVLAVLLVPVAQNVWLAREEARQRQRVESLFGEHVSETVARRLLEGPPVPVDGERRTITVLFADIRGFTALSEKATPENVVRLLNETLSALSDCVLAAEGTLDKYVGDCVMAFWNAPSDQPDHAARALRAALAMQRALDPLNRRLDAEGLPTIRVGVGINTGEAVVGDIGGAAMRDYTVIGNTVNLASRLESANKELGTSILAGEATYRAAGPLEIAAKEHSLAIRGVEAAVIAYSLSEAPTAE